MAKKLTYIGLIVLAIFAFILSTEIQDRAKALNATLAETKQELETIQVQVYEQETWLAELQADVWNLQFQDEAFANLWR
jgi:uncharacterized protein YoxC